MTKIGVGRLKGYAFSGFWVHTSDPGFTLPRMQTAEANPQALNTLIPSFAGLMELYESNYLRLRRLCPDVNSVNRHQISQLDRGSDLHLELIERTPYTTQLRLTYLFSDISTGAALREPDVLIRMYHDARQAEVLERYCRHRGELFAQAAAPQVPDLLCRWRYNRFLFKWLGFLLRQGHQFPQRQDLPTSSVIS